MTVHHFEELWEQCEKYHIDSIKEQNHLSIYDELILKINLYKALDNKTEISEHERKNIKSRILGEILFTLTSLSIKDDINVFSALNMTLQLRQV